MKKFILGFILGSVLTVSLVCASQRITLQDGSGAELGISSNPVIISF